MYCGNSFPDGMRKNDRLEQQVITPTTKAATHDVPISAQEILDQNILSQQDWDQVGHSLTQSTYPSTYAVVPTSLQLGAAFFAHGTACECKRNGGCLIALSAIPGALTCAQGLSNSRAELKSESVNFD